ncbi:MAG: hypothetical protein ACSHX0_07605 [Akkermansiaceae bacterium]
MIINKTENITLLNDEQKTSSVFKSIWGVLVATILAMYPKCPLCWAAYLSFFGLSGVVPLAIYKWLAPLLIVLSVLHLGAVGRRSLQRKYYLPLYASSAGFVAVVAGFYLDVLWLRVLGIGLVFAGSLTNAFSRKRSSCCSCSSQ